MTPPHIETSTKEERLAYVREGNVCITVSCVVNATYSKEAMQKNSMLSILKVGEHTLK